MGYSYVHYCERKMKPIGTCGHCGGPVCYPEMWGGVNLPQASCLNCGRYMKQSFGPVVEMEPKKEVIEYETSGGKQRFEVIKESK